MKRYSTLALLTAIISVGAQAMQNGMASAGALATAGAGAAAASPLAPAQQTGTKFQNLAKLMAKEENKKALLKDYLLALDKHEIAEVGVQATSDLLAKPTDCMYASPAISALLGNANPMSYPKQGAFRILGSGMSGLFGGLAASSLATAATEAFLPERLTAKTKNIIMKIVSKGSFATTCSYITYRMLNYFDAHTVPGGVPTGAVLQEKTVTYVDDADGQTKTRNIRYYALPEAAEPETDTAQ